MHLNPLEDFLKHGRLSPDLVDLGCGLGVCISDKFPDGVDAAGPGTSLRTAYIKQAVYPLDLECSLCKTRSRTGLRFSRGALAMGQEYKG